MQQSLWLENFRKRSLAIPSHTWKDTVTGIRYEGVNWVQVAKYKV
jgi:hypothetical protein